MGNENDFHIVTLYSHEKIFISPIFSEFAKWGLFVDDDSDGINHSPNSLCSIGLASFKNKKAFWRVEKSFW
jgi:hypothetical protein